MATKKWTKQEFLNQLYVNEKYKKALASAKTEQERKRLASFGTEFVSSFAEVLVPLLERVKDDPEFAQQLNQAISGHKRVVTSEPVKSGSTG